MFSLASNYHSVFRYSLSILIQKRQECETLHIDMCETEAVEHCIDTVENVCETKNFQECWEEDEEECKYVILLKQFCNFESTCMKFQIMSLSDLIL